jgi:penicillin-binding protein 2
MTSVVANGGYRVQPHIVASVRSPQGFINEREPVINKVNWINEESLQNVRAAMRKVVDEGSSRYYTNNPEVPTAGKTGTAQNPHGRDHGWFTSFAPFDDPQIVVSVLIENGGYGSISAAPVAAVLIDKYINGEITRNYVYNYVLNFESRPTDSELIDE